MTNISGSPRVLNCTFSGNCTVGGRNGGGGAMYNTNSSSIITNCSFTNNWCGLGAGGIDNWYNCSPTFTNCTFSGNSAKLGGPGGVAFGLGGSPTLTNCTFVDNSADYNGGGIHNVFDSNLTLTNCTFVGNSARHAGGGISINSSSSTLTNCILWGNEAPDGPQIYFRYSSNVWVSFSDVQDGWAGEGNIKADPCFVNPVDGDYHLLEDSPCINAGDPEHPVDANETDIDGQPRIIGGLVDMGADEFHGNNSTPIADAGEDQTTYADHTSSVEIALNGSGSYDDDGHRLTYLWTWTIDANNFTATGPSPTIELPVGEHIIELIVNDRVEDSEPDEVFITVVPPIESRLRIFPRTINRYSRQPRILALLRLPEGITRDQIDRDSPLVLYPGRIESTRQFVFERRRGKRRHTAIFAFFDKQELMAAVPAEGRVELEVIGRLKSGQYFHGSDTIRIINRGRRHWP